MYEDGSSSSGEEGDDGDSVDELDELADGPNETVFLIYLCVMMIPLARGRGQADERLLSFLFTLEEFAREMLFLLDTVSEVSFRGYLATKSTKLTLNFGVARPARTEVS